MISHTKQFVIPLLLLFMVACSSETAQQPPDAPVQTAQPDVASAQATDTAQPLAASPTAPPTIEIAAAGEAAADAAHAGATLADTAQSEPAGVTETAAPVMEASATATLAAVAINGRSAEGAYFLGREDAPLTIIDYSDFL